MRLQHPRPFYITGYVCEASNYMLQAHPKHYRETKMYLLLVRHAIILDTSCVQRFFCTLFRHRVFF